MIADFRQGQAETAAAWRDLLSTMQTKRRVEPEKVSKEVQEVRAEAGPEMEGHKETGEEEEKLLEEATEKAEGIEAELKDRTLEIIKESPNGLKMTQMADILDMENWRTLIPVVRMLLDEGKIKKEGSLYFAGELHLKPTSYAFDV
jgi:hypothetical protein